MNIRTTLLALVAVLGASSCGDWYVDRDEAHLLGYPRVCDQIVSRPMCSVVQTHTFGENTSTSRHLYVVENEAVQAEDFVLWVMTGAPWLREWVQRDPSEAARRHWYESLGRGERGLAPRNSGLERQLARDYNNRPEARGRKLRVSRDRIMSGPPHALALSSHGGEGLPDCLPLASLRATCGELAERLLYH